MEHVTDMHRIAADCLGLNPHAPETWPEDLIVELAALKLHCDSLPETIGRTSIGFPIRNPARDAFYLKIMQLLGAV